MTNSNATFHASDDASKYRSNASFVYSSSFASPVLSLLSASPGDVILDVGCGTGELTIEIARIVAQPHPVTGKPGRVYGIDAGEDMIRGADEAAAKYRASQAGQSAGDLTTVLNYEVVDAHDLDAWLQQKNLVGAFDKVFSNAALHWMSRSPASVVRGMYAALKPSGVLAAEMGGHGNIAEIRCMLHLALTKRGIDADKLNVWYFPSVKEYSQLLTSASFEVQSCELVPRLTPLPGRLGNWLETFAGHYLNTLPTDQDRTAVVDEVEASLRPGIYDAFSDQWTTHYVRLRVKAVKPADTTA